MLLQFFLLKICKRFRKTLSFELYIIFSRRDEALSQAAILAMVTLAITLIFKTSFTTNFAQGMIGSLVAYTVMRFYFTKVGNLFPWASPLVSLLITLVLAIIIGFIIGLFVDTILIRKSKYSTVLSKQMITMGLVLVISGLMPTIFRSSYSNPQTMPKLLGSTQWQILGVSIEAHKILTMIIAIVVISSIFLALKFTKWGLGVRATASNEAVASMMGINTKFITAMSWGIASGLGALAASLYAPYLTLGIGLMVPMQVNGFMAAILGGFTTFFGPVVGAVIIPIVMIFLRPISSLWNVAFVYVIILIVVLIKPVGLFGKRVAKKV